MLAPAPEEGDHQEQRHHDEVHEGEDQLGAELLLLPIRVYKHCATVQVQLRGVMRATGDSVSPHHPVWAGAGTGPGRGKAEDDSDSWMGGPSDN